MCFFRRLSIIFGAFFIFSEIGSVESNLPFTVVGIKSDRAAGTTTASYFPFALIKLFSSMSASFGFVASMIPALSLRA